MNFIRFAKMTGLVVIPLMLGLAPQATRQFGPYATVSPDTGTCNNYWADDSFDVFFKLDTRQREDGSYDVVQQFKNGTFVTRSGAAPDACLVTKQNPAQIPSGINGKMQGQYWFRVIGGEYNPNATPTAPYGPKDFAQSMFGPNARVEIYDWTTHYNAGNRGDWQDSSPQKGGAKGQIR